jgi:T5SS/PEP-CTERM-associated repeat protein
MSNLFLCRKEHARVSQARQNYPSQLAVTVTSVLCSMLRSAKGYSKTLFGVAVLSSCVGFGSVALGQTTNIWVGGNGAWETASNWTNSVLPTSTSFVIFSNSFSGASYSVGLDATEAVANVLYDAGSNAVTWEVSNEYPSNLLSTAGTFVLDEPSNAAVLATASFRNGIITVTNSAGTGTFSVGNYADGGMGSFQMTAVTNAYNNDTTTTNYPTLVANNFLVTSNSTFTFTAGTLTTYGGSIDRGTFTTFVGMAPTPGLIATWNIFGGTNSITYLGSTGSSEFGDVNNSATITSGGTMSINVSGSNTLWALGGLETEIGWNGLVNLTISGGAVVTNSGGAVISRNGTACSNNTVVVTGAGTQWRYGNYLYVGDAARSNALIVSAGAQMTGIQLREGVGAGSSNNVITVTDPNTTWNLIGSPLTVIGGGAPNNTMIISNGAQVTDTAGTETLVGSTAVCTNNQVFVDGAGTLWQTAEGASAVVNVGNLGPFNGVTVKNGGQVVTKGVNVGAGATATNNSVLVTGANSLWNCSANFAVGVGSAGTINPSGNLLTIANGGQLDAANFSIGNSSTLTTPGNSVVIAGGAIVVTNSVGNATLYMGRGANALGEFYVSGGPGATATLTFNSGTATVNALVMSSNSVFNFNGGVLNLDYAFVTNGSPFVVGNGAGAATLNLLPNFVDLFSGGLNISANGTLTGIATISNNVTLASGATLAPGSGATVGALTVKQNLTLGNSSVLQYSLGANSDLTSVGGNLTLGGTLNVTDSGGFGVGTYTLFTYTGALTYNGVTIGTTPNASLYYAMDTSTVGQVNLDVSYTAPAGPITGSSSVNAGDSGDSYSISSVTDATTYTWSVPSGATIVSGQGTTSITVNFGCSAVSGSITVTPSNGSGSGASSSLPVTVTSVGAAGSVTGPSAVNAGDSGDVYSISSVGGATTYAWTVPSGATITSGQGTTSITVNYSCSAVNGTVQVTPSNGNGCSGTAGSLSITVTSVGAAGSISGTTTVCAGSSGLTYSISSVSGATSYTWSVPSDATITSGQGSTSITVTWGSTSGSVSVTPANGNACTGVAGSLSVTVNPLPSTPTAGNNGPIIEGNTLNLTASTIASVTYSWTGPNGFTSTNQNPSISNATSAVSGVYLVTVIDSNGCTSAAGSTTALVTALRITSITTQGSDLQITWATTGGVTNAVQATIGNPGYNTNFVDISGPILILGSGDTSTNYIDVGAATNSPAKFYRVRLVQ